MECVDYDNEVMGQRKKETELHFAYAYELGFWTHWIMYHIWYKDRLVQYDYSTDSNYIPEFFLWDVITYP